jgi:cell division protein ZapA
MAQVSVTINGRGYQIACDDGQEPHLTQLGQYVDKRVKELVQAVGQVGDSRLLVMVSLLIADELAETYADLKRLKDGAGAPAGPAAPDPAALAAAKADGRAEAEAAAEAKLAEIVEAAALRIEQMAAQIAAE